jgi:hypothetical protein
MVHWLQEGYGSVSTGRVMVRRMVKFQRLDEGLRLTFSEKSYSPLIGYGSLVGEVVVHFKDRMWVEEAVIQWQERFDSLIEDGKS